MTTVPAAPPPEPRCRIEVVRRLATAASAVHHATAGDMAMAEDSVRTITMPEFTPGQIAHLEQRREAARRPSTLGRVGGVFTGPWPRMPRQR